MWTIYLHNLQIPDSKIKISAVIRIPIKDETKYLVMVLEKKLLWAKRTNYLIKKCELVLNILWVLTWVTWGADVLICLNICRSRLDHGCINYSSSSKSRLKYIEIIFRCYRFYTSIRYFK